ncbi:MAG: acetyltransferase-like isoleucine patch superfamily enzyme [Enterobacterales bacterium]|jgi:acetyltransferase-like isoleucine patch superfamily enzyme
MVEIITLEFKNWFLFFLVNIPGIIGSKLRYYYWSSSLAICPKPLTTGTGTYIKGAENMRLGGNISLGNNCLFDSVNGELNIGEDSHFNQGVIVVSAHGQINIGKNVLVGPYVVLRSSNHKYDMNSIVPTAKLGHKPGKIIIGNNVWIGANSTILSGAKIGDNCVIGAGAVVNSELPPNTVAGGVPARVLKSNSHESC